MKVTRLHPFCSVVYIVLVSTTHFLVSIAASSIQSSSGSDLVFSGRRQPKALQPCQSSQSVCSSILTVVGGSGEPEVTSVVQLCACPDSDCLSVPAGNNTMRVAADQWHATCAPLTEVAQCEPGKESLVSEVTIEDQVIHRRDLRIVCKCPGGIDMANNPVQVHRLVNSNDMILEVFCGEPSDMTGEPSKRGHGVSSFYKRFGQNHGTFSFYKRYPSLSAFYKRSPDLQNLFLRPDSKVHATYKRSIASASDSMEEGEENDQNSDRLRRDISAFYKRGPGGSSMSAFYKRNSVENNLEDNGDAEDTFENESEPSKRGHVSAFYKRGFGGVSSFYKRGMSSFYKRSPYGMSSFYKRGDNDNSDDEDDAVDEATDEVKRGLSSFYKRNNLSSFYKRGLSSFYKKRGAIPGYMSFYKRAPGSGMSSFYKRSGLSSFYKRPSMSSFYKRDLRGVSSFYKRDDNDSEKDEESEANEEDKRSKRDATEKLGNERLHKRSVGGLSSFYKRGGLSSFYKRGPGSGLSSFYKRSPFDGYSSFYKRSPGGDLYSFYKRGMDSLSSFYKRGLSSFYKRDPGHLSSFYKRSPYGNLASFYKRGLSSFYKRGYGPNSLSAFYKRSPYNSLSSFYKRDDYEGDDGVEDVDYTPDSIASDPDSYFDKRSMSSFYKKRSGPHLSAFY